MSNVSSTTSRISVLNHLVLAIVAIVAYVVIAFFIWGIYRVWAGGWHPLLAVAAEPIMGSEEIPGVFSVNLDNTAASLFYLFVAYVASHQLLRWRKTLKRYANAGGKAQYFAILKTNEEAEEVKTAERARKTSENQRRREELYTKYPGYTDREVAYETLDHMKAIHELLKRGAPPP